MLLNLTVLYFAFSTPVGVYGVIRTKGRSPSQILVNVLQFVFWPLFAAISVRNALTFAPPVESLDEKVNLLRAEFEAEIDRGSLADFRDVFARYTGLAMAVTNENNDGGAIELLETAGRYYAKLGSKCLARRDRRRLEFHLLLARNEFVESVPETPRSRELTDRLANLLNDVSLD